MTSVLLGVGGTGAKIVEAAIVLLAAGLGPKRLHVGLVDQDNSNGNVARTRTLISNYRQLKEQWGGANNSGSVDWRGDGHANEGLAFCRTDVVELFGDTSLWCPGGDQTTLRNTIGQNLNDQQKDLFDLLFTPGEEEQDLALGEGYRGRAHVGSAALISRLTDARNPLSLTLGELMAGGGGREQVNIFIAGSSFGGTGAAGFPTIARELNRIRNSKEFTNKGRVAVGGALMLPYFGFAPPDADEANLVVTTDELLPKAQLALEHYGNLFATEQAFDRFYLVGWDRFFQLGYHEAGNAEQRNPPLLPEVFAAAAALEFLGEGDQLLEPTSPEERVRVAARSGRHVRWKDIPLPSIQQRLGQLLRFAVYWRYIVSNLLEERRPWVGKGNWTHQLTAKGQRQEAAQPLITLDAFLEKILVFAASLEAMSPNDWDVGLWRTGPLHDPRHEGTAVDPVELRHQVAGAPEIFSELIRTDDGEAIQRDAAAVYDELENHGETLAAGAHQGYGRVLAAAYRAARLS